MSGRFSKCTVIFHIGILHTHTSKVTELHFQIIHYLMTIHENETCQPNTALTYFKIKMGIEEARYGAG